MKYRKQLVCHKYTLNVCIADTGHQNWLNKFGLFLGPKAMQSFTKASCRACAVRLIRTSRTCVVPDWCLREVHHWLWIPCSRFLPWCTSLGWRWRRTRPCSARASHWCSTGRAGSSQFHQCLVKKIYLMNHGVKI